MNHIMDRVKETCIFLKVENESNKKERLPSMDFKIVQVSYRQQHLF
jgi:hypothetical protein